LTEQENAVEGAPLEDRIAVVRAMAELPDEQRAVVALCLGEGFSHSEAAEILKMPLGTVKSHVTRGRERLLRTLEAKDGR
jgi:RNA polymerase sigma-70 factor (ECF subfamily)